MTMIGLPAEMIGTPFVSARGERTALISDLLGNIRLSGALFLLGKYTRPWALDSPGNCELAELLSPGAERLLVFHTVREGRAWVSSKGYRVELEAGDLVVLPAGDRHQMGGPGADEAIPIAQLLPPAPWNDAPVLVHGGGGEPATIVCGYFRCDELLFNAVLRSLPPVFKVRPSGAAADLLRAAITYAVSERGTDAGSMLMARVPELLLVEALRLHSEENDARTGWLAATGDPVVSRALKLLHDDPRRDWGVEELARSANTSRSVLGERFKSLLGQSPIRYLVEWRMQLAANLLRTTPLKLAAVAEQSGYGSEAAFSRAFHRHLGQSPAQWRQAMQRAN
jgi:AraC-like DNA-binding protein